VNGETAAIPSLTSHQYVYQPAKICSAMMYVKSKNWRLIVEAGRGGIARFREK
jgi:hypothetical protein